MILLTLDTNSDILSACVTKNEKLLSEINIYNLKNHSINSINIIDCILKNSNIAINDVDGFILSKGPGSFTGLRIAFSIIKAFSFSLKKPMISLSSLDSLCFRENFNGIGKPEPLKGDMSGFWSRRIDDVNRLVYRIIDNVIEIVSCKGHYED